MSLSLSSSHFRCDSLPLSLSLCPPELCCVSTIPASNVLWRAYPRVLVHCCRHPNTRSRGHLKLCNAVCDVTSHCYYSRLTSPHCLYPPVLWAGWRVGKYTHTHTRSCCHSKINWYLRGPTPKFSKSNLQI